MEPSKTSELKVLLEGASKAVLKHEPGDIVVFLAFYFQELVDFREENPNLDLTEVVEELDLEKGSIEAPPGEPRQCAAETSSGELGEKTSNHEEALLFHEPQGKDACPDTVEDNLPEELTTKYSSKTTQFPSITSVFQESKRCSGAVEASSPEGSQLASEPADPALLAACDPACFVRDVATSVETLQEDDSAASAAEASRSQLGEQPWSSMPGEPAPSDSLADIAATDVNQVSSVPFQEEPSPLPPPPLCKEELQALPRCNATEAISVTETLIMDAEVPPYIQWFPDKIIIPISEQTSCLFKIELPLNAGQVLGPPDDDVACQPERTESPEHVESAEQVYVMSG